MSLVNAAMIGGFISESAIELYRTIKNLDKRVYSAAQKVLVVLKAMISLSMIAFVSLWSAGVKIVQTSENLFFISGMLFLIQQFIKERLDKHFESRNVS